ncbi:hypothetical protein VV869_12195 [Photobacterium sp. MCCC 1A19761]|uniref:hypothetical protein n=1 Tax=Photobacterium sp. MCCC 1A19761 TaxID=3115000 RepID=UPI00307D6AB9
MKRGWIRSAGLALSLMIAGEASAVAVQWDWITSVEHRETQASEFFPQEPVGDEQSIHALLDVELRDGNWMGSFAVKGDDLYNSDQQVDSESQWLVRELFWQGPIADSDWDLTLGKVRLGWGVGYGYRPLDIITPYPRHPVGIQVEEGAGVASVSMFDQAGEWTMLYADTAWVSQDRSELAEDQRGIGLRRYWLSGDHEWQGIAYYDDVRHGLMGAGWVTVLDEAWALHVSSVYQRRYEGFELPASPLDTVQQVTHRDGWQALLGFTWASAAGHQVVLEYWYDNRSWHHAQWQTALHQAEQLQRAQLSTQQARNGLRSSYGRAFQAVNLVRHNVMLHWTMDPTAWQQGALTRKIGWLADLTPTVDVLFAPEDQGVIATQWLAYSVYDSGEATLDLELAARFMTGDRQSVFQNLPDKRMIFLNLKGRY